MIDFLLGVVTGIAVILAYSLAVGWWLTKDPEP